MVIQIHLVIVNQLRHILEDILYYNNNFIINLKIWNHIQC